VVPNPHGVRAFEKSKTLRLTTRTLFLRTDAVAPVGAGGGGVRHLARGHRPKKVIVHVARAGRLDGRPGVDPRRRLRAIPAASGTTNLGPDAQARFGCKPPFPSL
jgi:hypothetical protein